MSDKKNVSTGVICWFDPKKGFGFITKDDGSGDLFVHWSNVQMEGFKTLKPEQKVSFEVGENHHGPQAINVTLLEELK